jgi:hypothetical protein
MVPGFPESIAIATSGKGYSAGHAIISVGPGAALLKRAGLPLKGHAVTRQHGCTEPCLAALRCSAFPVGIRAWHCRPSRIPAGYIATGKDLPIALLDDAVAIAGVFLIVSAIA